MAVCGTLSAPAGAASAASLPGVVLTSATATLPSELSPLATGKRIQYVTTDINGSLIYATALILTPKTNKKNRTVAWAHGSTGLADQCAPSANQNVFWPEARTAVAALLSRGWTVAATDYAGLGTTQSHPYLVGGSEARAVIDSVKAARNLDSALSTQYVIDGHSQGGQAALFASQIAPSYDGALVLKGTASIAPVSNVDAFAPLIPGTPGQGYLVMGLYGLAAVDSTFNPNTVLAAQAKTKTSALTSGCLMEILAAYENLTAEQLLVDGALPDAVVTKLANNDNPAQTAPSAPILIVQGTDDEAVPYFITHDLLLPQLQAYTQPVTFTELAGATHDSSVVLSASTVATWIAARFT
ncbi:lipase [Paractinoplanes durhamensis]|uniref:Lipase n=1 Tax=Paractinoplanes durhamensis TaxID=113563 RepID=A0ABQ3YXP3_9ACTN|nr:alpha/beta fold hydrolase [Actinoplanes durhamensis]GIE02341.1 lipase [Actinoplanes durhamensis]